MALTDLEANDIKLDATAARVPPTGDAKQQVVGTLKQEKTLSLDDACYQQAMTSGIPYTATVPITGAATIVKVLVYDYGADLLGTAVVRLK